MTLKPTSNTGGGGGGPATGTYLPTADPTGVTVDTATYDNPVTGSGKLTTLVFPQDTAVWALAVEGDAHPRWLIDVEGGFYMGDGTQELYQDLGAGLFVSPLGGGGVEASISSGSASLVVGQTLINVGLSSGISSPLNLGSGSGSTLSSNAGAPGLGGNVGDIYIRSDGGALSTIYRCTTAGTAGVAVWTGIL